MFDASWAFPKMRMVISTVTTGDLHTEFGHLSWHQFWHSSDISSLTFIHTFWRLFGHFLKWGVPPFIDEINHPAILGYSHFWKPPFWALFNTRPATPLWPPQSSVSHLTWRSLGVDRLSRRRGDTVTYYNCYDYPGDVNRPEACGASHIMTGPAIQHISKYLQKINHIFFGTITDLLGNSNT